MGNVVNQCPKCGNYVKGEPVYSTERKLVHSATKQGANSLLKWGITGGFTLLGAFFGGIGAIPGFFIGLIISFFFGNATNNVVEVIDQELYSNTTYKFECPRCGRVWQKIYTNKSDTATDEMLENKRQELVNGKTGMMVLYAILFIIAGLATWGCYHYCQVHESSTTYMDTAWLIGEYERTDYHWGWYIMGFLGILVGIGTVILFFAFVTTWIERSEIKNMSISEFRNSEYRFKV